MFCITDFRQTTNRKLNCVWIKRRNHFISNTPLKGQPDKSQTKKQVLVAKTIIFATGPLVKRWNVVSLIHCDLVNTRHFRPHTPLFVPHHCLTKPSRDTHKPDRMWNSPIPLHIRKVCVVWQTFKNDILIFSGKWNSTSSIVAKEIWHKFIQKFIQVNQGHSKKEMLSNSPAIHLV